MIRIAIPALIAAALVFVLAPIIYLRFIDYKNQREKRKRKYH